MLAELALPADDTPELGGVGGKVDCLFIQSRLAFVRADGKQVNVQGPFAVFADKTTSDVSILGRDVTNNFDVIYTYPTRRVILLAPPHEFLVQLKS